ncbi:HECT domain-containing protein [Coccidioides immitis RS]|uniref:HECT-type E3 ubiquitin transferase n=3 Tax=Coccidioides immitis TaxID=5501 RepID=J3KIK9_COCIM|nr:HECT domain-containing protein [Coccidioides immitis RS]EAS35810.3 HECT domain-containing protein [Coccidioides immitis RS]KMP01097.1 ubiquitin-protein ligase E3A [Coccidioides immitis RMSCC 2394]KMU83605.1 ubiquitin-protein ligase E3A [Coccidioides immitis H538.4]TPX25983.1 hypothetical protein DIZ76_011441 [Coccidioides immitis]
MTRLHGVVSGLSDSGHRSIGDDRAALRFSKLPPGTPEVILKNTVIVNDPARILSRNKDERQRNFNLLVRRYKTQLLHGCKEPNCTTPTCLSYRRRRAADRPFRNFNDLSARTLACYLASQDDPEGGLCGNAPARSLESFAQEDTTSATERWPPLAWEARTHSPHPRRPQPVKVVESISSQLKEPDSQDPIPDKPKVSNPPEHIKSPIPQDRPGVIPQPKTPKDPRSITQNLFDTLALRMIEWLPLKRASNTLDSDSLAGEGDGSGHKPVHADPSASPVRRQTSTKAQKPPITRERIQAENPSVLSSQPPIPPTLEVKVPGQPVHRLSFGELDRWKHSLRSLPDDIAKTERKSTPKLATTNTPTATSRSFPSPPPRKHRSQKYKQTEYQTDSQRDTKTRYRQPAPDKAEILPDPLQSGSADPRSPPELLSPASPSLNVDAHRQAQLGSDMEPQIESLSMLSKDIVDSLGKLMFETKEEEGNWKDEMMHLESRGCIEPRNLHFATPRQRQIFPFITQSLFFVLSSPELLRRSFRITPETSRSDNSTSADLDIDTQNLEGVFRKLYSICPWEATLHSLWMCLEGLFVPPKEFSTSKTHRRFIWRSTANNISLRSGETSRDSPSASQSHISDCDAAHIAIVTLFALASSIPPLDAQAWQVIRRVRSTGTVLPDFEMRKVSEATAGLLAEATDKFEHDLALRLMNRLVRAISARLAFHEISKLKGPPIQNVGSLGNWNPVDLIITSLQPCISAKHGYLDSSCGVYEAERQTTIPMVAVEWLKGLLLKEWDGKPEILKSGAAGGALVLLASMYHHRAQLGLVPEDFYTAYLGDNLDPLRMPIEWMSFVPNNRTMHILSHQFMFEPSALVTYFRALNFSAMAKYHETAVGHSRHVAQTAFSHARAIDDDIGLFAGLKRSVTSFLVLIVRRDNVLTDTLNQLWRREKQELMRPLRVQMGMDEGEEGADQGGVQQELFRVVMAEILDPAYGMFTLSDRDHTSWFQPCSFEPLYKFELAGLLMSLAIYNGITLPVNFPVAFYMKLLDFEVKKLDDIRSGWEDLARGLSELLSWSDGDVGDIFLRTYEFSFDAFGKVVTVDMTTVDRSDAWPPAERNVTWRKERLRSFASSSDNDDADNLDSLDNGESMLQDTPSDSRSNRRDGRLSGILKGSSSKLRERRVPSPPEHEAPLVTNANREQFVNDYIFWLTDKSIRPQYEAFARGFYTCLDRTALSIFTPQALKSVVEGIQEIDMDELEKHTRYEGYNPEDRVIRDFWDVVKTYPQEKRSRLLEFVTASDRVPVKGVSSLLFIIMKNGVGDERLPTSGTCFGRLLLPEYSSRQALEENFDRALEYCKGFGAI